MSSSPRTEPALAVVVPIRNLDAGEQPVVRRRPGRPRKVMNAPSIDERHYHAKMAEMSSEFIDADPLLRVAKSEMEGGSAGVLDLVLQGLAAEQAGLLWERQRAQAQGKDAATLSSRRVDGLMKIAHILVAQGNGHEHDLPPEKIMSALRRSFLATVSEITTETMPPATAAAFMEMLGVRLTS
jgi:hypothetical protein